MSEPTDVVEYEPPMNGDTRALDRQMALTQFGEMFARLCYHEQRLGELLYRMSKEDQR